MKARKATLLRLSLVTSLAVAATVAIAGQAQAAPTATNLSAYQTSVPTAAKAAGLDKKLSTWTVNDGVIEVGLTSVNAGDLAKLQAKLGSSVAVHQQDAFSAMAKRTPISEVTETVVQAPQQKSPTGATTKSGAGTMSTQATQATPGNYPPYLDSSPYWGGGRITSIQGQYITSCTVTGSYGTTTKSMMTAGHCGPAGVKWQSGYYDEVNKRRVISGDMGTASRVQWGNDQLDSELLTGSAYGPYVWISQQNALKVAGIGRVAVGAKICTSGSFTGHACGGTVASVNVCSNVAETPTKIYRVCGLDIANAPTRIVQHGDSGGPVLSEETATTAKIAGTISAGNEAGTQMLFADAGRQLDYYGISPTVG